ncbi:hypothetical protein CAOG_00399 [Capsaspora owczarzaki ATCC 30864]|uniref:Dedicator of cytokinesis protein 3 n=1 Tax=Capsaspora owczarzaki (strain ATCC 30864) TaxID=595528 RepID=A0A0D2WIG2_CAPO3|nr:hypothetical protein CAOG_00399 [Capsaspora owczarzaki ATCC 30864]KJE88818.1 hypothetical protein CAOG_000399 [Capsaspora owczarzaki ATCC 30864]|eukprot:XP_004365270.1 hypothetical protein CAOG_00399 [Capsaspora owczarzaki ATCC 30864]
MSRWVAVENNEKYGVAIYNFQANGPAQLSLDVGQPVQIFEKCGAWYRGSFYGCELGEKCIFPTSYIQIKECVVEVEDNGFGDVQSVIAKEDPLAREAADVLRVWGTHLPTLFLQRQTENFFALKKAMLDLLIARRQLQSGTLPQDQIRDIRLKMGQKIDSGNRRLNLDLVPRSATGEAVEAGDDKTSVVELYRMHRRTMESLVNQNDIPWTYALPTRGGGLAFGGNFGGHDVGAPPGSPLASGSSSTSMPLSGASSPFGTLTPTGTLANMGSPIKDPVSSLSMGGGSPAIPGSPLATSQSLAAGNSTSLLLPPRRTATVHHLLFELKNFVCPVLEETEVFFSLYNATTGSFLTEDYFTRLNKSGMPNDINLINNMKTLFMDLSNKDLDSTVYLVCRVLRVGKMLVDDKDSKKGNPLKVRRPYGGAVLDITDILNRRTADDEDKEHTLMVYQCADNDFSNLHDMLIRRSGKFELIPRAKGIYVTMKLLSGEIEQVKKDQAIASRDSSQFTKKLGFPDVIYPGDLRNDLYVTLVHGDFQQGRKSAPKNVEVAISVHLDGGEILRNCIAAGSGDPLINDEFQSVVFYHTNTPRWSETIRLHVPIDQFKRAHLKFYFRHMSSGETKDRSEKTFGFSWLPLVSLDHTTIADGPHVLDIYKHEKRHDDARIYLKEDSHTNSTPSAPSNSADPNALAKSPKETFTIRTLLCSTKLTQNSALLALLKWRDNEPEILNTLKRITFVGGDEIVKFLQDIFDALFAILDKSPEKYGPLVFDALVFIIGILADKKYSNFHSVLDVYIQNHFSAAMAHVTLLNCLASILKRADDPQTGQQLRATMKALEYFLRFLIQSRLLYSRAHHQKGDKEFLQELRQVIEYFNPLMSKKAPESIIGTQTTVLQYFPAVIKELMTVYKMPELAPMVAGFIESIPMDKAKSKLIVHKLQFMSQLVQGALFQSAEGRFLLLPTVLKHVKLHLENREDLPICVELVCAVLSTTGHHKLPEDIDAAMSLLRPILNACSRTPPNEAGAGEIVACLLSILHMMPAEQFESYHDTMDEVELADFLNEMFACFLVFTTANIYPRDWAVMGLLQNYVILKAIELLAARALENHFLVGNKFKRQLWNDFLRLNLTFITQDVLQLEKLPETRRSKILIKYSDMRVQSAVVMKELWDKLGPLKIQFVPALVGPLLETTLIPVPELREISLFMLADMAKVEYAARGVIRQTESETIDRLDELVGEGKGDVSYIGDITNMLTLHLTKPNAGDPDTGRPPFKPDAKLAEYGAQFASTIQSLLELLLRYRTLGNHDENRDERASVMHDLLLFFEGIHREDNYYRYVDRLRDLHVQNNNFTEAGFALGLYGNHLQWSDVKLPAQGNGKYPAQTMRERKAAVYNEIIGYFDKGKDWEVAIQHCKILAVQLETELFDYTKMSEILQREARFFNQIVSQPRYHSEYFRVGYYGKGFPVAIRNREFVYRGDELERIAAFVERIQAQYPEAQMVKNNAPVDEKTQNDEGQHIQIVKVDPTPPPKDFKGRKVAEGIERYYALNDVNTFTFARPFRKGAKSGNEFADLWTEKTTLVLAASLPNVLRRSQVIESKRSEISPIENALDAMSSKNKELIAMVEKYEAGQGGNVSPFTMALNGIIDAAVNGGTEMYKKAFFVKSYIASYPEHAEFVRQLKISLDEQMDIVQRGLTLHARIVSEEMRALHSKMETFFTDLKKKHAMPFDETESGVATPSVSSPSVSAVSSAPASPPEQRKATLVRTESSTRTHAVTPISAADADVADHPAARLPEIPVKPLRPARSVDVPDAATPPLPHRPVLRSVSDTSSSAGPESPDRPAKPAKPLPGARSVLPPPLPR